MMQDLSGGSTSTFSHLPKIPLSAKEFRVGNWLTDRGNIPFQIEASDIVSIALSERKGQINIDYNVIPFTVEWMFRFGIKYWLRGNTFQVIDNFHGLWSIYAWQSGSRIFIRDFHYVHEFQNLNFALTGNELEIISEK